jgi:hypothetical protein
MTLENARNIATVVAAGAAVIAAMIAVIGIGPLFKNLRASQRSLRSKVYFDTLALLEGQNGEVRALRHVLEEQLKTARKVGLPFDILTAEPAVVEKLDTLARSYDKVGLLVKHGVVPVDFLFDFYSRPIVTGWTHIGPLVRNERNSRDQSGHMLKFEVLAVGASLYREAKYQEAPKFSISAEDVSKWRKWKKWSAGSRYRRASA